LQLLARTTPISELLRALRRARVPEPLCSTISLLHRYSFVLVEESKRMRRARAGRTLHASRVALWRALGSSIGLLFVRSVSRAERVQAAIRARGGM
jgi:cobalt/nickel transport system permease protein